jgi:hypothetical protein
VEGGMSILLKITKIWGKAEDAQKRHRRRKLTSAAASSIAIDCSCIIQLSAGTFLENFAKREGWYEYSSYEYKVSVIEEEAITSMGIETGLKVVSKRVMGNAKLKRTDKLRITNPMQFER